MYSLYCEDSKIYIWIAELFYQLDYTESRRDKSGILCYWCTRNVITNALDLKF